MAVSTSYNQIPSSSTSPHTVWDVFLSFRGTDTRNTFTDHLYKALQRTGIRTFKDDPDLRSGEVISDTLMQAIQDSKAYIIVLSENYASSSWCLDELIEILNCYKRLKRLVVPVFYNIQPSVARHQHGSFKEAFETHQTRIDIKKVNKWRLALSEIANVSGHHISRDRSQADIIDEVVDRISLEINPKTLYVAKHPVGLDSRVESVTELIKSDPEGVIRIGLHGMGGVGKTTLAKALYNQNYQRFQGSCFLANVREVSGTENGLVGLQHQLIVDVLKCNNLNIGNKDQGIELIRARLCSTKVLLVVDDLDNLKPLEYLEGSFALGSLIVITTRNEDLLDRIKVNAKYKVNQMDKDESRQLFNQHAFRDNNISHIFTELSNEILEKAGGLPLALQVFGSTLLDESEDGWRWFIDKLKRAPIDDVEENLMISFDALKSIDPNLQDIFLDIACFYIGWKKEKVVRIMETCYTFVNRNINILMKRCILTINDQDELGMHDLLREMGRKIARNNSPDEPGKHRRLWVSEDIDTVLKNHKGTEATQGIFSGYYYCNWYFEERMNSVTFVAESFKRMSKLKFLYLNNVNLTGSFEQTFEDLRWLRWAFFPLECLPSEFYAEKLVILELPYSNLRTSWKAPQEFKRLKTLDMSGSEELKTTPDFNRLPCLVTLDLSYCSSLEEVHVSIGILESLVHLNLRKCTSLRSLPDSICNLRSLEILDISDCEKLEELPDQLGMITSLRELNVKKATMLRMLPDISQLSNIKDLHLKASYYLLSISELPTNLKRLLATDCTSLERLGLSGLKYLKSLDLESCEALKEIQGLEEVTSLEDLTLWSCRSLERLPNLCNLKHLKWLYLYSCEVLKEIQGLEEVTSLEYLNLSNCRSMERLPNLSNLKHLRRLDLRNCASLTEVIGLEEVTYLEDLEFCNCGNLLSVSGFPSNQEWINAQDCTSLKRLPDLSSLKHLKKLDLKNCRALKEIQGLEEVTSLEHLCLDKCSSLQRLPNLCNLKHLKWLDLENCVALKEIQGLEEVTSVEYLNLSNCRSMERLPNLSNLKHLRRLDLRNCASLTEVIGLEEVTSLEYLEFCNCGNLLSVSGFPSNQEWINAQDCTSLKRLPDLSSLKHLKKLDLKNCRALKEIQGLEEVTSLEHLRLDKCSSLQRLPNLCNLKHLKWLDLEDCVALKEIQGLEEVTSLEHLNLSNCRSLERLPNLCNLKHLKRLDLRSCEALKEIQGLEEVTSLEYLRLWGCRSMERLPNLCNLKHLEDLNLSDCRSMERLPNLCNLKHLKRLNLSSCHSLTQIIGLEELTSLLYLDLGYTDLLSISKLPPNLEWIDAASCTSLKRTSNLSNLKKLRKLDLRNCSGLTKIQGLEELNSLQILRMAGCNSSFLECTLTMRFFEILSRFGHEVEIIIGRKEFRARTSLSSEFEFVRYSCLDLGIQLELGSSDLQPNASHNFLAIILAFEDRNYHYGLEYSVKNITSGFVWSGTLGYFTDNESSIVLVPSSILSIGDGDNKIELKSDKKIVCRIHLLYKTEIEDERSNLLSLFGNTMSEGDERSNPLCLVGNTVNVREQRSNPLHSDLGSNRKGYSFGSSSTTVNVGEKRSNPLDNDLESNKNWLSLGNSSTTVRVEENRSYPSKRLKHLECDNWLSL